MRRSLIVALLAGLVLVPAASADRATLPANAPQPWTANSLLEQLAARIASHIGGRPTTVHCETYPSWHALGQTGSELGTVRGRYDTHTNRFVADATLIELAPQVCQSLQKFAQAAVKPTKCQAEKGGPFQPCFLGQALARGSSGSGICSARACFTTVARETTAYWRLYHRYVEALLTLAHEAIHIQQIRAGAAVPANSLVEAQATCSGMQWLDWVAVQFGAAQDDAQALARFEWQLDYPQEAKLTQAYARSHPYWSAECKPGGSLDIRAPGSTFWP